MTTKEAVIMVGGTGFTYDPDIDSAIDQSIEFNNTQSEIIVYPFDIVENFIHKIEHLMALFDINEDDINHKFTRETATEHVNQHPLLAETITRGSSFEELTFSYCELTKQQVSQIRINLINHIRHLTVTQAYTYMFPYFMPRYSLKDHVPRIPVTEIPLPTQPHQVESAPLSSPSAIEDPSESTSSGLTDISLPTPDHPVELDLDNNIGLSFLAPRNYPTTSESPSESITSSHMADISLPAPHHRVEPPDNIDLPLLPPRSYPHSIASCSESILPGFSLTPNLNSLRVETTKRQASCSSSDLEKMLEIERLRNENLRLELELANLRSDPNTKRPHR